MSNLSRRAAATRLNEINSRLDADELQIVEAMVARREALLTTARAMRLRKEEALELLRRALDKVSLAYAEMDARDARAVGALH